jgi:1,4-dihydroxy-6-naphthoate synthase
MTTIHVAHSPDSDDAFMFYALASGKIDTEGLTYVHELQDIETLNQRALRGELEVTAVSIHAYAYLSDRYALLPHGASMGDRYGPRLVARRPMTPDEIRGSRIAIPGPLTSAYLALRLFEPDFTPVPTAFDQIEDAVANGLVDLGLLIHEGQLTYS